MGTVLEKCLETIHEVNVRSSRDYIYVSLWDPLLISDLVGSVSSVDEYCANIIRCCEIASKCLFFGFNNRKYYVVIILTVY